MTAEPKPSFWKRPIVWVPLVALLFVLAGALGLRLAARFGANRDLAAIQKRGHPISAVELDSWYKRVPESENAALVVLEAAALHVTPRVGNPNVRSERLFVSDEPISAELLEEARAYIEANREALDTLAEAAKLTRSRYPVDLTKGAEALLPHLMLIKQLAQLSRWAAVIPAHDGDGDAAIGALTNGFAAASTLAREPLLISELVRLATLAILLQGTEHTMRLREFNEPQLASLEQSLARAEAESKDAISAAIVGERALGISTMDFTYRKFSEYSNMGGTPPNPASPAEIGRAALFHLRRGVGLHERDKAFFVQAYTDWERASLLPFPEMVREAERLDVDLQQEVKKHPLRYIFSGMLLPSMAGTTRKEAQLVSRLRCARTAVAIERFRLRHNGRVPSAGDLVPDYLKEFPRDAADNQPLHFEKLTPNGYKILAVTATELANEHRLPKNRIEVGFTVAR